MPRLAPTLAFLALALLARPVAAETRFAYVDLQRAIHESEVGKQAKNRLRAEFEKKQKDLESRQEELRRLRSDLDKQEKTLAPEALKTKQHELQLKLLQLQEAFAKEQQNLQNRESEEIARLLKQAAGVVAQIAQDEGISYVLEKNGSLVYAPPAADLTNEVIRKLNTAPAPAASPAAKPAEKPAKK